MQDQNETVSALSHHDWKQRLEEQSLSGLTIRAYCKEHGLREATFHYHKKKHRTGCGRSGKFIQIPHERSRIRLKNLEGHWCVEVERGFDAKLLRELLGVLRP